MQSIETTYHVSPNTKGSRIVARASDAPWRVERALRYDRPADEEHAEAAKALARKLGWTGRWVGASTKRGMVWVPICETAFDL